MNTMPSDIFVARQPIFKRNMEVFGYELLFRSGLANFFDPQQDGEQATSKVITNSFLLIGIPRLAGGKKVFINFTEEMLLKGYPALFPKDVTVVEVLENVVASPAVAAACASLAHSGYVLALDDFLYEEKLLPLIRLAKIIKFDIKQMSLAELARQSEIVRRHKLRLLAEKIETNEEFEQCKQLGFDLFQGYFFSKPTIVAGRDIPGSKLHYLQVLRLIQNEGTDFGKLSELIGHDVSLAYKLLKYVNSSYFARPREIPSINEAVVLLGEINLRKWLSLMMLSYIADDKPTELLRLAILRGELCELIGRGVKGQVGNPGQCYTAGMFSLLPAMLDRSMTEILNDIPLAETVRQALLGEGAGTIREVLQLSMAYERGNWGLVESLAEATGFHLADLPLLYDQALASLQAFDFDE